MKTNKKVAIIMGSDSDLAVMKDAAKTLEEFGIDYDLTIVSAHRTPERMFEFSQNADNIGYKVIIAAAGGAAHLPGMTASITHLPVIGVPIKTKTMEGLDSFLSMAQMPSGVPVATVSINGATNAALLAVEILAITDENLVGKMKKYKSNLKTKVQDNVKNLEKLGLNKYIKDLFQK